MAGQDVVVTYRADVDDLTQKLKIVIERMDKLEAESKQAAKGLDTTTKSADKLDKELSDVGKTTSKATNDIKNFAKSADATLSKAGESIKSIGLGIATSFGAAFTADAVINFSKASVNAFQEAEKNAEKLKFAITTIGGESSAVYDKLIEQSKELQSITIFSDDSIQQAQAALAQFGLTGREIEKLIPKLADFATITSQDIPSAAQQIGAALEGNGREFKKYGIEVSATATRTENLNAVLEGLVRFEGAAENATKTLTGQLEQANNRADELQESVGEKLAPSFARARVAILEMTEQIVDFVINTDQAMVKLLKTLGLAPKELAKNTNIIKDFSDAVLEQVDATKTLAEFDAVALKLRNDQTAAIARQEEVITNLENAKEKALSREIVNLEEVRSLTQAINKQRDTNLKNEVTKLNIIEDILAKQRETLTKTNKETKEVSDARVAGSAEEVKAIKRLSAEYKDLFEILNDQDKAKLIELSVTAEIDPEQFKIEVAKLAGQIDKEVVIPVKLEVPDDRKNTEMNTGIQKAVDSDLKLWLDHNETILNSSIDLFQSLSALYDQYAQAQVERINQNADAQIEALDRTDKANQESLDKGRISEREAFNRSKQIEEEKLRVQEEADKKSRAIKRKAAILDKAAALIQIAIDTARASAATLAETPLPAGAVPLALTIAAGAAQAALVAAQPIPYKKGTKSAKGGLSRVGEEGEEIMYVPSGSKVLPHSKTITYGDVLDKMFDGTFDKHYMKRDVAPRLVRQIKANDEAKSKSFASNVSESIVLNSHLNTDSLAKQFGRGLSISNVNELAEAISRHTDISPYRR